MVCSGYLLHMFNFWTPLSHILFLPILQTKSSIFVGLFLAFGYRIFGIFCILVFFIIVWYIRRSLDSFWICQCHNRMVLFILSVVLFGIYLAAGIRFNDNSSKFKFDFYQVDTLRKFPFKILETFCLYWSKFEVILS